MPGQGSRLNPSVGNSRDAVWTAAALAAATGILGFGVLFVSTPVAQENSLERQHQLIYVLLIGLLGIFSSLRSRRRLTWVLYLLPFYVAFQIVPLPLPLLRVLSPSRAELADSLAIVMAAPGYASLSVVPSVTFRHLTLVIAYVLILTVAADTMSRLRDRPWLAISPLIVVALAEAVFGLSQSFAGPSDAYAQGTYPVKTHFAGLLEMVLPFAIMYSIAALVKQKYILACLGAAVAATLLLGIVLSFSRMAVIATVLSCVMMGVLGVSGALTGWKRMLAVGAVCGAGLVSFFLFPPIELIQRFSGGDEGRVTVWRDTLHLIRAYPVFGCGLGGYESAFPRFKNSLPYFDQDYAHSDYLQGLAELGLAGFAIVATSVVFAISSALRSIRKKETLYFGLACAGAIIAILVHSAVDFNLYIPANATVLAWILGVTVGRAL